MRGALILVSLVVLIVGACSGANEGTESGAEASGATAEERLSAVPTEPDRAPASADPPADEPPETAADAEQRRVDEASVAIVRAWSAALNAGDNEAAGELFAPNAVVIQGPNAIPLPDATAAALFTASLPCSGQIVEVRVTENVVTAVFELGDRETSRCDAQPGSLAAADFLIEDGAIVVWQQVPVPAGDRRAGAV